MRETVYPKMFQNVPPSILSLSWKFHENPFRRFPAILLTDKEINKHTDQQGWKHNLRHLAEAICQQSKGKTLGNQSVANLYPLE